MVTLPKVFVAELTPVCNHQCIFCSCPWENDKEYKPQLLSANEWKNILTKIRSFGVKQVTFTGGEATTRKDLFEILDCAYDLGFSMGLISNGKLIDDEFLNKIKKYNLLLSISVPGIKTFKETTKIDGIDHTLEIFTKCKKLGIKTTANITVTKKNIKELYENIALPLINGAEYVLLNRFLPGGRGLQNKEFLLSLDEINQMLDIAEEVLEKSGVSGHIGTELPLCIVKNPDKYKHINVSYKCAAAKEFFVIDPSGFVKVCNHSPKQCCHWTEIDNIIYNEYWNKFINSDYIPDMCKNCKYLSTRCDGGCREAAHVTNGAINAPDPCFDKKLYS